MSKNINPIIAEIIDNNTATAVGISAKSPNPILALCRLLVDAGHNPNTPLEAYRGGKTLCLRIRSIEEAAGLEINGEGNGFRPARKPDAASPVRPNGGRVPIPPPKNQTHGRAPGNRSVQP